jgi:hypothetical protein
MITFDEAVPLIMAATRFSDLPQQGEPRTAYRKWVKVVHPDAVGAPRRATATLACARLSDLYRSHRDTHFSSGDIADLFTGGGGVLLKVPRDPADNGLMETEAEALRKLRQSGDSRFRAYAPRLVDSFIHADSGKRVNVLVRQTGTKPLAQLRPDLETGIWIWRRLLAALGWAHRAGVVHGAVLDRHLLIHQRDRGLVLVDWCYAGHRPKAIVKAEESAYPPEVLTDKTASPATDIYMATGVMTRVLGERLPRPLSDFAAACRFHQPRDAWQLLAELDELIPQRYRN